MKTIKCIYYILIILSCSFTQSNMEKPILTVYSDNDPDMPTGVILVEKRDNSYIAMCCGGFSPQSAACVIKSEGNVIDFKLEGLLVDVNTRISSYHLEENEKLPFLAKIINSTLIITDSDVSDLCGLNAVFVRKYFQTTSQKDFIEWVKLFYDLMKEYEGNDDLLPILKRNLQTSGDNNRNNSVKTIHEKTLKLYKEDKNKQAAEQVLHFLTQDNKISVEGNINKNYVNEYNDFGFFLEQGKKFKEAVTVLEEVVKVAPERTVAYINLGDAYWGMKDIAKANEAYDKYIELMKKNGKEKKIPERVSERVK